MLRTAWNLIDQGGDQDLLGFGTVADGEWLIARLRSDIAMDHLAPEHSSDWRSLGVSVLHVLVLNELLADTGTASCRYVHSITEVLADTAARNCDLACLVPPARMSHVESIASNLETMPPKSTYFYPKLPDGARCSIPDIARLDWARTCSSKRISLPPAGPVPPIPAMHCGRSSIFHRVDSLELPIMR